MKTTAYAVIFEATLEETGIDIEAAVKGVGGRAEAVLSSADGKSHKGRARIRAESAEEALRKLREAVESAAAAAGTTVDLRMEDARPVAGIL